MNTPSTADKQPHLWIKDIKEDSRVRGFYLVKVKRVGTTKKGDSFLSITLGDRTGDVEAKVWEKAEIGGGVEASVRQGGSNSAFPYRSDQERNIGTENRVNRQFAPLEAMEVEG